MNENVRPRDARCVKSRAYILSFVGIIVMAIMTMTAAVTLAQPFLEPQISSVSHSYGPLAGGQSVLVQGANLSEAEVAFGGVAVTSLRFRSNEQIEVHTPAYPTGGTVSITVRNPYGVAELRDAYTYAAPPTITEISPSELKRAGGENVTIRGTGLLGADIVYLGSRSAQIVSVAADGRSMLVRTSTFLDSSNTILVFTPGGDALLRNAFTLYDELNITVQPIDTAVGRSRDARFTAQATGHPEPTVQWQYSATNGLIFGDISGATSWQFTFPRVNEFHDRWLFRAVISNSRETVVTNAARLTVTPNPTANQINQTVAFNSSVELELSGSDPLGRPLSFEFITQPARGTLSGSPPNLTYTPGNNQRGSDNFWYVANAGNAQSDRAQIYIVISDPILAIETPPSDGRLNEPYNFEIVATGGTGSYSYYIGEGALPHGLQLSTSGTITGVPNVAGRFPVALVVRDVNANVSQPISTTIDILPPELNLIPPSGVLPNAKIGSRVIYPLRADGGSGPYHFAVTSGAPPPGLTVTNYGAIEGYPNETGTFNFEVTVTDRSTTASGGPFETRVSYTLTIDATEIAITAGFDEQPKVGSYYSTSLEASGGTSPYVFTLLDNSMPLGLSLDPSGVVTGTPASGGAHAFSVLVEDSSIGVGAPYRAEREFTVTVDEPEITIAPLNLERATKGAGFTQILASSGGTSPYSYAIASGALPIGIELSESGTLSGTPMSGGDYSFTVTVTDSSTGAGPYSESMGYSLVVDVPVIEIIPTVLEDGITRLSYTQTLTASGGVAPYTYAVTEGALPSGITLAADGTLSGTTTLNGSFAFTATATDVNGNTGDRPFMLIFEAPEIAIAPQTLMQGTTRVPYTQSLIASGGVAPYTFAVTTGALPAGISLAPEGTLTGTTTTAGTFSFTATATDSNGNTGSYAYSLAFDTPAITIAPPVLQAGTVGLTYTQALTASGGTAPYIFAVTDGVLPTGIALATNGTLSGTTIVSGSFAFTATATDANGFMGAADYTVQIDAPSMALSPDTLLVAVVDTPYTETITASGGSAPYRFALIAGALPSGVALHPDGTISGTPGESGSFDFTVEASDANGFTASRPFSLSVGGELPVAADTSSVVLAGSDVTIDLTAGATGGPFTDATILAEPDPRFGSASLDRRNGRILLRFVAELNASGQTSIVYTLSNAFGTSAPATLTVRVETRPDPSLDREVIGLLNAQASTATRFAQNQITNFGRRLEQLHNEGDRRASSMDLRVSIAQSSGSSTSDLEREAYGDDGMTGPALSYAADRPPPPSVAAAQAQADNDRSTDPAFYQPDLGPFAVWTGGFVNFGQRDNGGFDLDYTMIGVSGGIDYRFSDQFVGGFGVGYGRDRTDIGSEGTESRATAFSGALYGSYKPTENIFIDGLVGASTLDFQSLRFVTATRDYATGQRSGSQIFAALTAGYEHRDDRWLIWPYGRIEASRSWLHGFTEQGGDIFGLTYGDQQVDTLSGVLGLRANYRFDTEWGTITPGVRAEYTHDFAGSSRATVGYSDIGSQPFAIETEPTVRDHVSLGLSLDWQIENTTIGFDYDSSFGDTGNQDHRFGVRIGGSF